MARPPAADVLLREIRSTKIPEKARNSRRRKIKTGKENVNRWATERNRRWAPDSHFSTPIPRVPLGRKEREREREIVILAKADYTGIYAVGSLYFLGPSGDAKNDLNPVRPTGSPARIRGARSTPPRFFPFNVHRDENLIPVRFELKLSFWFHISIVFTKFRNNSKTQFD